IRVALERFTRGWVDSADTPEAIDRAGIREALMLQFLSAPDAILDPAATADGEAIVAAAVAEGEAAFERKLAYLQDVGEKINVPDVDRQVVAQVMLGTLDEKWK